MQVTEISAQGLRREYKVVLPAADLATRLETELAGVKEKVRINGFRPGKVPLSHLKRLYGRSLMSEVVQNAVNEANRKIVADNGLRLALEPKVDLASDQAEVERAMEAQGDLSFTVAVETIPTFDVGTFDDIAIERPVAEVADADVDKAVDRLADQNRVFEPKAGDDATAAEGDKVTIDFVGTIDGEPFEGGTGEDVEVIIGSGSFIPGFEDKLVGAKAGEDRSVEVKFPENYLSAKLADKDAVFDVKVKTVAAPGEVRIDEDFAKGFGFDAVDAMRDAIRSRMQEDLTRASRDRLKRVLLDALDKKYSFELPEGLVAQEFSNIWSQVEEEHKRLGRTFEDEKTTEEEARAEYRRIAERRVRLGLVLAEVGEKAGVKVEDGEVGRALAEMVRQYPGQEQKLWDYYRKNPEALSQLKAPIFEDKVVDHIVGLSKVTDRSVPKEELFRLVEESAEPGDDVEMQPPPEALAEPENAAPEAAVDEQAER